MPPSLPTIVRYDSGYAQDVASGVFSANTSRSLAARLRGSYDHHHRVRPALAEKHVRGHAKDRWNDKVDEAAKLGQQALSIAYKVLGPNHETTMMYKRDWGT